MLDVNRVHRCGGEKKRLPKRPEWRRVRAYRTFANSVAKALRGVCSRSLPPRFLRSGRCWIRVALGVAGAAATGACGPRTSFPFGGCAGFARRSRSSNGARSKRRMIDCISSAVGASTKAKPLDSCVSWLRITFTASATKSSAASHCLMSSAVTQVGRLPRKTVKLIQLVLLLRWLDLRHFKGRIPICHLNSIRVLKRIANDRFG